MRQTCVSKYGTRIVAQHENTQGIFVFLFLVSAFLFILALYGVSLYLRGCGAIDGVGLVRPKSASENSKRRLLMGSIIGMGIFGTAAFLLFWNIALLSRFAPQY